MTSTGHSGRGHPQPDGGPSLYRWRSAGSWAFPCSLGRENGAASTKFLTSGGSSAGIEPSTSQVTHEGGEYGGEALCSKCKLIMISASWLEAMAEGEGFEPSIRFPVYTLSRRAPSTTRPPLRVQPPAAATWAQLRTSSRQRLAPSAGRRSGSCIAKGRGKASRSRFGTRRRAAARSQA